MASRFPFVVIALSCAAYSGLFAMPLWIGGLTDDLQTSSAVPGYMGSVQLTCSMLASLWVAARVELLNQRSIAGAAVALIFIANAACAALPGIELLFLARAVSGVGEGLLLASLNAAISRSTHPDRYFALSQTTIALFGIGLFLLGPAAMAEYGTAAVFAMIAAVALASAAGVIALPDQRDQAAIGVARVRWSEMSITALLALAVLFIGCQGAWAYMERFGAEHQLSIEQIGRFLVAGQLVGLLGPLASNRFSQWQGRRAAIVVGLAISAAATLLASQPGPIWAFAAGAASYQFGTLFIVTSYFGYLAAIDRSGKHVAAGPALINLGSALGPASMAIAASIAGYAAIGWLVVCVYLIAVVLLFSRRTEAVRVPV